MTHAATVLEARDIALGYAQGDGSHKWVLQDFSLVRGGDL